MSLAFVDVDTQMDFVSPAGALYAPGAEKILPQLAKLTSHAAGRGIPIFSTMDAHSEQDPEFKQWPHHCVAGTLGQRKHPAGMGGREQRFIEKRTFDCFTNPALAEELKKLAPERVCVYGVVTEVCVKFAVDGLIERGFAVSVVTDAIQPFDEAKAEAAMAAWRRAGVKFVTTASLCG
jgi:nicotinamidase/pyrazinamidase